MGASTSKSPTRRSRDGGSSGGASQDAASAAYGSSPVRVSAGSSSSSARASSDGRRQTDDRRQQELDDEAFARHIVMEEIAALGGGRLPPMYGGGGADGFGTSLPSASGLLRGQAASQGGTQGGTEVQTARAGCPFCNAQNEFQATPGGPPVMMQCGGCSGQFQVAMPAADTATSAASGGGGAASSRTSLQLCRRCGTMNQFPAPLPGQPMPDVLCGFCGAIAPGASRRRNQRSNESRLIEQMLQDSHHARGRAGPGGPMVRVNVGGQRRLVPLALLLALMSEEADKGNPAQQSDIAALPTRKLQGSENLGEQMKCTICLEEFGDGDDLKTLPCLHIYHQKCIEQWLGTDNSCPVCKTPIGHLARST